MRLVLSKREIPTHLLRFFKPQDVIKPKDDMLVPEALATALRRDGWWVRSRIIWAKKACMPESVTDRPTNAHEHIWLLTKASRYFYDAEAVREAALQPEGESALTAQHKRSVLQDITSSKLGTNQGASHRNQRNVWHLGPEPFPDAHFATFPTEIPRRAIKAGTSEHGCCEACGAPWVREIERGPESKETTRGMQSWTAVTGQRDSRGGLPFREVTTTGWAPSCQCDAGVIPCTVLDPFLGSGTTLMVADQLGRNGIGVELNEDYALMAERRIRGDSPMFADVSVESSSRAQANFDMEVA